jgi:hypothetical protein
MILNPPWVIYHDRFPVASFHYVTVLNDRSYPSLLTQLRSPLRIPFFANFSQLLCLGRRARGFG